MSVADASLALAALGSMRGSFVTGANALTTVCERYGRSDLIAAIAVALDGEGEGPPMGPDQR